MPKHSSNTQCLADPAVNRGHGDKAGVTSVFVKRVLQKEKLKGFFFFVTSEMRRQRGHILPFLGCGVLFSAGLNIC